MTTPTRKSNPKDLLQKINEKKAPKKASVLEEAAQDWARSKADNDIEEELKQATKSKSSYLDKQLFLQRSDMRQFERERQIRERDRTRKVAD